MVGLVIVSHSAQLAEGVAELARGMAGAEIRLAAVGGLDLPGRPLGTDAVQVLRGIESVYADSGVLVLMDLGSAVLSAEMALDLLSPDQRANVLLCEAPLVEGAVVAAVQARLGSSLAQVAAEARAALSAKQTHLLDRNLPTHTPPSTTNGDGAAANHDIHTLRLIIHNPLGLHARPAARLVQTASRFEAAIQISNLTTQRGPVNARSINAVITLGVRQDHEITVTAAGVDAEAALTAIRTLAEAEFEDSAHHPSISQPIHAHNSITAATATLRGIPASPGFASGPAYIVRPRESMTVAHITSDPHTEWRSLQVAIEETHAAIQSTQAAVAQRADQHTADIFAAHLLFLEDETLSKYAQRAIFEDGQSAAAAWHGALESVVASYQVLDDAYLRARVADLNDVGGQVSQNLSGGARPPLVLADPCILITTDLTPTETAHLDPTRILGVCLANGGPTAHSAILARTLGIPAIVGLGAAILAIADGTPLIIDGEGGGVIVNPDAETASQYRGLAAARQLADHEARTHSGDGALTRDGRRIEVAANIGSVADARAALAGGAEGVGLFRTEFLFLDRAMAPTEDEQYAAYRAVAEVLDGRALIIRTLDVGGDKPLAYIDQGREANPFLGWRAIRLCLAQPEFFKVQLRAIVRVAAEFPVKIMFPMIATLGELRAAKALLDEACIELSTRGESIPERLEVGMMVEIPASAVQATHFAAEVDFFSIGTNDLIQYTLAAERGNPKLAALSDGFQPAVLQLIRGVVEAAHARRKWVGICGELAGDPLAVALLCGLGIDELSMSAAAIPRAKEIIRGLDYAAAGDQARAVLMLESAEAIRAALTSRR